MKIPSKVLAMICICILAYFSSFSYWYADETEYVITSESSVNSIVKIQTLLKKLWAYEWEIDWEYNSIEQVIIDLQIEFLIITNDSDEKSWKIDNDFLLKIQTKYASSFEKEKNNKIVEESIKQREEENVEDGLTVSTDTKFVVTAYYSPLPGQKKYATGSYSWDIRLNGEGTHWASWAAVHEWFLAAPKNYPFGTKIYLDGIGVWIVEDRGWAIVNAGARGHSYDRIDVWMWYGDTGLTRALNWGKRTVDGKILWEDSDLIVNFQTNAAAEYFNLRVNPDSSESSIKQLQELLTKLNRYSWEVDGKYKSVEQSLIDYQIQSWVIEDKEWWWAWYFWEKTFFAIQRDLNAQADSSSTSISKEEDEEIVEEEVRTTKEETVVEATEKNESITNADKIELKDFAEQLEEALNRKADGNRIVINNYNNKIKKRLEVIIQATEDDSWKAKLSYLLTLIN